MSVNRIFGDNLLSLVARDNLNAKSLTELINTRVGAKSIDHSYVAKIIKQARNGDEINPSLDKAAIIAKGFNLSLVEILRPNCLNVSPENALAFDSNALSSAFRHTDSFCDELGITDPEFKAKAFEIQYWSIVSGKSGEASAKLMVLAKEFNI